MSESARSYSQTKKEMADLRRGLDKLDAKLIQGQNNIEFEMDKIKDRLAQLEEKIQSKDSKSYFTLTKRRITSSLPKL